MEKIRVKDVMIPLEEYATVAADATLFDAVLALEEAQRKFDKSRYTHRAILVLDPSGGVIGKLGHHDVVAALEPEFGKLIDVRTKEYGYSMEYIQSVKDKYELWEKSLEDLCKTAAELKVKDITPTPEKGEYIPYDKTLDEAIHQLVMGKYQSLLATFGPHVVGVVRLTDVFTDLIDNIKECRV